MYSKRNKYLEEGRLSALSSEHAQLLGKLPFLKMTTDYYFNQSKQYLKKTWRNMDAIASEFLQKPNCTRLGV
jgi:hypothetical protein